MVVDLLFKFKANIQAIFNRSSEICKMIIFITKLKLKIFIFSWIIALGAIICPQSKVGTEISRRFFLLLVSFSFFRGGGGGSLIASLLGMF